MTMTEFAKAIDCSPKTVSEWIIGKRNPRDLAAVKRCASVFNVSLHYLLFGEEDPINLVYNLVDSIELHTGVYELSVRKVNRGES